MHVCVILKKSNGTVQTPQIYEQYIHRRRQTQPYMQHIYKNGRHRRTGTVVICVKHPLLIFSSAMGNARTTRALILPISVLSHVNPMENEWTKRRSSISTVDTYRTGEDYQVWSCEPSLAMPSPPRPRCISAQHQTMQHGRVGSPTSSEC